MRACVRVRGCVCVGAYSGMLERVLTQRRSRRSLAIDAVNSSYETVLARVREHALRNNQGPSTARSLGSSEYLEMDEGSNGWASPSGFLQSQHAARKLGPNFYQNLGISEEEEEEGKAGGSSLASLKGVTRSHGGNAQGSSCRTSKGEVSPSGAAIPSHDSLSPHGFRGGFSPIQGDFPPVAKESNIAPGGISPLGEGRSGGARGASSHFGKRVAPPHLQMDRFRMIGEGGDSPASTRGVISPLAFDERDCAARRIGCVCRGHSARVYVRRKWQWDYSAILGARMRTFARHVSAVRVQRAFRMYLSQRARVKRARLRREGKERENADFMTNASARRIEVVNDYSGCHVNAVRDTDKATVRIAPKGGRGVCSGEVGRGRVVIWRLVREDTGANCRTIVLTESAPRWIFPLHLYPPPFSTPARANTEAIRERWLRRMSRQNAVDRFDRLSVYMGLSTSTFYFNHPRENTQTHTDTEKERKMQCVCVCV